jgi:hypothetical protein
MTEKRMPTKADIEAITARLYEHRAVNYVNVDVVLNVTAETMGKTHRREIYDLERKIMEDYPDLLVEFRLRT